MPGALEGIRVIEWAAYHVGPAAGVSLADLGAEVIKIEDKAGGDPGRMLQLGREQKPASGGRSLYFEAFNRGKKGITLDLKQEAAREVVYRLAKASDVFFTNFRYEAAQRLHMDYETLRRYNPKLIYAHASGFGFRGEDAHNPAFDMAGQARAGIMFSGVDPNGEPVTKGGIGDHMGGVMTAYGILAALVARERTGVGQMVDTSIMGGIMWLSATSLVSELFVGESHPPTNRKTSRNPIFNTYKAKDDKWLVLTIPMGTWWRPLCQALGREDLVHDPRFATIELRTKNSVELIATLDEVFAQKDREEWLKILQEADCPAAPVNTPSQAIRDPQAIANEYVVEYDHPLFGPVKLLGCPVHFSETPANVRQRAPDYGEHTEEVLFNLAHYSKEEIATLKQQGVI